jgi:hypothetical protein
MLLHGRMALLPGKPIKGKAALLQLLDAALAEEKEEARQEVAG